MPLLFSVNLLFLPLDYYFDTMIDRHEIETIAQSKGHQSELNILFVSFSQIFL